MIKTNSTKHMNIQQACAALAETLRNVGTIYQIGHHRFDLTNPADALKFTDGHLRPYPSAVGDSCNAIFADTARALQTAALLHDGATSFSDLSAVLPALREVLMAYAQQHAHKVRPIDIRTIAEEASMRRPMYSMHLPKA